MLKRVLCMTIVGANDKDDTMYETALVVHRVMLHIARQYRDCFPLLDGFESKQKVK